MKWHFFLNIKNVFPLYSDSFVNLLSIKFTFMDKACLFQVINLVFQSLTGVCKKICFSNLETSYL